MKLAHSLFPKMKVDFKKQNVRTFEIFYESTGLTEANFLRPLAKLCIQDAHLKKSLHVNILVSTDFVFVYKFLGQK